MKKFTLLLILAVFIFAAGCSGKARYHKTPMPDPKTFNAHFGDMDADSDDLVDWDEFKAHFSHATEEVFKAIDANGDQRIDHDEWHRFKEAHGLKHME